MKKVLYGLCFGLMSCSGGEMLPELEFVKPAHFPEPVYDLSQNRITKNGFELGKALFFEPLLSRDGTVSCADCHQQSAGFTHHGHDLSHGIDDRLGTRNSPPVMNLAWHQAFMWDGGIPNLDLQPIGPIENHLEMDESLSNVLQKLRQSAKYRALFKQAFGSEEITTERFLKAFSQFMLLCISSNSAYDKYVLGKGQLSAIELEGLEIVKQKCGSCHSGELFSSFGFADTGLPGNDLGRGLISLSEEDNYKFKIPSLRNLGFTAPYMHDGRFYTLEEVLDFYTSQKKVDRPTLHPEIKKGITLSRNEKEKVLAFLNTLNDTSFIKNKLFEQR
jgi:cytochrome c peroxidase